jgi:hypothetical protein
MRSLARLQPLALAVILCSWPAVQVRAQIPSDVAPKDPYANFPFILPLVITDQIFTFRSGVEADIKKAAPTLIRAEGVSTLADSLVARWDRYGDFMVREHGDFYEMSRGRAYWLIVTDDAADTLTDRLGGVLEKFVKANPAEKLSPVRADWEVAAAKLGIPSSRIFGFQFVELARRGAELRNQLIAQHPEAKAVVYDAYVRFLWDLMQFYRQLHSTWFDRHTMRVAQEDWVVHRLVTPCKNPQWKLLFSLTAIGVDTMNVDPMKDRFMHRIVVADPACPDTADFVMPLPHYRLMEQELNKKSDAEKQQILDRMMKDQQSKPEVSAPKKSGTQGRVPAGRTSPPKGVPPR